MAAVTRTSARWSSESGAELIEFALVLPLLLLMVLGIIDFGFLFQRYEVVTNAAREGARVAVLPGYAPADAVLRVDQYLTAGGLTEAHPAPAVVPSTMTVVVGGVAQCVGLTAVTVTYPHTYSFVAGIAAYFGGNSLASRTSLRATATMRNELPAASCP
jgi:Flp pilus assembly protein TadG